MDRNVVEVNKKAQEERGRYPATMAEHARLRTSFPADTAGNTGREGHLCWGSQSQSEISFTFPADEAIAAITHTIRCDTIALFIYGISIS